MKSFKVFVSNDFGLSYVLSHEGIDRESIDFITGILESNGGYRWYVENQDGEILSYGKYQKGFIDDAIKMHKGNVITTDDPMVQRVLKSKGIPFLDSDSLIARIKARREKEKS